MYPSHSSFAAAVMPAHRFEPSSIRNKIKREEISRKQKREKRQQKLQRRLLQAKEEARNPKANQERLARNVPRTLDNARDFDPSYLTSALLEAGPSHSSEERAAAQDETSRDITNDFFASYFSSALQGDGSQSPKALITTSMSASKSSFDLGNELVNVIPGSEFIRRKKGKGQELGRIAPWAAERGFGTLIVINEDMKKSNALTITHLPKGPTAYFKLSSIQFSKQISGHARPTSHFPELVLNNFSTRLGHMVGRLFQTVFPPMPEFEGRQVVTFHNQRDFIFFRRHRYAFRSTDKAALQEIGPRFTLKLRWIKKGLPPVHKLGCPARPLTLLGENAREGVDESADMARPESNSAESDDGYLWYWKPELETTRRTFFL